MGAYAQRCREPVKIVFTGIFPGAFHSEKIASSASFAFFGLCLKFYFLTDISGFNIFFWIVFIDYEFYLVFNGIRKSFQKFFQFFEPAEIFFFWMNVRVIIINRDVKNTGKILKITPIFFLGTTAAVAPKILRNILDLSTSAPQYPQPVRRAQTQYWKARNSWRPVWLT